MSETVTLIEKVERLKVIMIGRATGNMDDNHAEYASIRRELIGIMRVRAKLPPLITQCRSLDEFWSYISAKYGHYKERREHIWEGFTPVVEMLEIETTVPADDVVSTALSTVDSQHVKVAWDKALERRSIDPDGAITSARTLIECVCKFILEKNGIAYDDKMDLPSLYGRTADSLNIAPSQQTEATMRQVLGGCQSVVSGIGALRNKLSDAHGKGSSGVTPEPRHAELAVNIAGAIALFLISTWEASI